MISTAIDLPVERISEVCRRYPIRELAVFGSVLRKDFRPDSDIDLLVDLKPHHGMGLVEYIQCQQELSEVIGRQVDLVQKSGLKHGIRNEILSTARVIYAN